MGVLKVGACVRPFGGVGLWDGGRRGVSGKGCVVAIVGVVWLR